ncbi:MAG TPA: tellurium resistance protein TerC [Deltaproteobacteria bacterium]|nr:tellurium resistance protein TerC [Deltaproteobacteria bacterium]
MSLQAWLWIVFVVFILGMLLLDLLVFNRKSHVVKVREAILWSLFWIALALLFNIGIYFVEGHDLALRFLSGYLVEKSLSVDNLFIFLLIFSYFRVPALYQHKVLFWGIFGALVFRAIFIFAGIALLQKFHWLFYILGAFLIFTGIKLIFEQEKEIHPEKNPLLNLVRRLMPCTDDYEGDRFFVRRGARLWATPLFIVLVVIETTDVIFAVDSVPAVLAISQDPFIVFSSNAFAILGLRALFFALSGMMEMFHYLNYGLAAILTFIGVKMILSTWYKIPIAYALGFIALSLLLSALASVFWPKDGVKREA